MKDVDFDVIIVGAGVCGALIAAKLAAANCRVMIIEAGPDKTGDRIAMAGDYASAVNKNPAAPYRNIAPGYILGFDKDKDYYDQTTDGKANKHLFKSSFLRLVGGSTWHFLGNVPRFIPSDFKIHEQFNLGTEAWNWPIEYRDLDKYYCEAEWELGVSGDHAEWDNYLDAYRTRPYPMSKIWQSYSDQFFLEKVDGQIISGKEIAIKATPQARNSTAYDGRPACAGNSSCVPICPIQAKYDATVHVKKAIASGAVLLSNSVVTNLKSANNGTIQSLTYVNWQDNKSTIIDTHNAIVVLATHAIETPRLLLHSGIANESGEVGKNLMDHLQGYGLALASEPVYPFRGPITTSGIDAFRDGEHRKEHAGFRMSIGNDAWGRTESPAVSIWNLLSQNNYGAKLRADLEDRITKMIRISFSTEMLPNPYNCVSLSDKKDLLGIPKPKISFQFDDYNRKALHQAYHICGEIFKRLGWQFQEKTGSDLDEYIEKYSGAGHIMGTTRMGNNPKTSVVNSFGQTHQHSNLFIAGPSVFTTSGTANPTLTAAALSLRTAEEILSRLKTKE